MDISGGKMIITIIGKDKKTGRLIHEWDLDYTGSLAARQGGSPSEKVEQMKVEKPELDWEWKVKCE